MACTSEDGLLLPLTKDANGDECNITSVCLCERRTAVIATLKARGALPYRRAAPQRRTASATGFAARPTSATPATEQVSPCL